MFHIPNENHHHDTDIGVRPGVPDLFLPVPMGGRHGLFIEMKRADGGRLSEAQKRWLGWLGELGYEAVCCHGWIEAREAIETYMGTNPDTIPRYAPPTWAELREPPDLCEGCDHMLEVELGGRAHFLCLSERDQGRDPQGAWVIDRTVTECDAHEPI